MRKRKVPLRKCIISNEMKPKQELIRIVRSPEGEISIDETGKKSGRGAYLAKDEKIIKIAKEKNSLAIHLKTEIPKNIYDELLQIVMKDQAQS